MDEKDVKTAKEVLDLERDLFQFIADYNFGDRSVGEVMPLISAAMVRLLYLLNREAGADHDVIAKALNKHLHYLHENYEKED